MVIRSINRLILQSGTGGAAFVIDTESSVTFLGFEEQQEERKRDRVKELLEKRKQREQQS